MTDGMRYQNLGVVAAELPPSAGNPRNSEGTFLELADGELIFVYSRFKGDSPNDHAITLRQYALSANIPLWYTFWP